MLVFSRSQETLPVSIDRDATSGLPLLHEQDAILQLIMAYLALPYSVTEYGCGKKASIIIRYLLDLDIPAHAVSRGMILETDLSPQALREEDYRKRKSALVAWNPLCKLSDLRDPALQRMLRKTCSGVRIEGDRIHTGPYVLQHTPQVQFVQARSHIYPLLKFWDDEQNCVVERVIDPSIHRSALFAPERMREFLQAPQALLLEAPLLARFRLDPHLLTPEQAERIRGFVAPLDDANLTRCMEMLSHEDHADLIRKLTGAETESLGDPETWTYANNMLGWDMEHDARQARRTGRGDDFRSLTREFLEARENRTGEAPRLQAELRNLAERIKVRHIAAEDAAWSEAQLAPLADVTMTVVYYNALEELARTLRASEDPLRNLTDPETLQMLRGLGVRLRRRIDWLADASREEDGRIDARALRPGFVRATVETIRQMRQAGLTVCIDRVGNCHGLQLHARERTALERGERSIRELLRHSIAHGSHIDTVNDAGKFDGRLGVLGGVETAHLLQDLAEYKGVELRPGFARDHAAPPHARDSERAEQASVQPAEATLDGATARTHVIAFIGEEMTFTGEGVSMPGSAAVAGRSSIEKIHKMTNGDGDVFRDRLIDMLRTLQRLQEEDRIDIFNDFQTATDDESLLAACSDPTEFYTPHTYERHIEQGPVLDRAQVPIVLVGTIMGIHQEDFFFEGDRAEAAALELNRRMRELCYQDRFADVRLTAGIIEGLGEQRIHETPATAMRWTLEGELNHAGATLTQDRRDPGVAAGRLARRFQEIIQEYNQSENRSSQAMVGNVRLLPGTNRNVIPGSVSLTLSVLGEALPEEECENLSRGLQGFALGTLSKRVSAGGEGVRLCRMDAVSYATSFAKARLTIDLRSSAAETTAAFRERITGLIAEIEGEYDVEIAGELQQELPPFPLEESGQALLMERSYGGSHNPNEAELLSDLVRGCILQFAVLRDALFLGARGGFPAGFNLFRFTEERMPREWLDKMERFTSGALHDTCNTAARATGAK